MDAHEKIMYDWMDKEQTYRMQRRQQAWDAFDTGTIPSQLPVIPLPSELVSQYRGLHERQCALKQEAGLKIKPQVLDNAILQAWRWKSLLIRSTLLCALNGICEEIQINIEKQGIAKYTKVGMECHKNALILQDFKMVATEESIEQLNLPKYLFCTRIFDMERTRQQFPNNTKVDDGEEVNLLECKYSLKRNGNKLYSKLIRRNSLSGEFLVKRSSIKKFQLMPQYRSRRFASSNLASPVMISYTNWL